MDCTFYAAGLRENGGNNSNNLFVYKRCHVAWLRADDFQCGAIFLSQWRQKCVGRASDPPPYWRPVGVEGGESVRGKESAGRVALNDLRWRETEDAVAGAVVCRKF